MNPILLRFNEVALKGDNRGWFQNKLLHNIRKQIQSSLGNSELYEIRQEHGRLFLYAPWSEEVKEALERVFGLSGFSPAQMVATERDSISQALCGELEKWSKRNGKPKSFRIKTRRSDKVLTESSVELDRIFGKCVQDSFPGIQVSLKEPDVILGVEIRRENSYLWTEKFESLGGLPVGSNGPVLALLSGGIDSPVAALRTLRRGSAVNFIHFYGTPFVGDEVLQKIEDLVRQVNRFQGDPTPLYIVPFGKIQEQVALVTQPKLRTLLYRRLMLRISCELAKRLSLRAVITGESLGQVASQTLENLTAVDAVATLTVLRPLIGFDKSEIITEAKKFGTYDISIRPAVDCCTLFADRHPAIRANDQILEEQEKRFSVDEFVESALTSIERRDYSR